MTFNLGACPPRGLFDLLPVPSLLREHSSQHVFVSGEKKLPSEGDLATSYQQHLTSNTNTVTSSEVLGESRLDVEELEKGAHTSQAARGSLATVVNDSQRESWKTAASSSGSRESAVTENGRGRPVK